MYCKSLILRTCHAKVRGNGGRYGQAYPFPDRRYQSARAHRFLLCWSALGFDIFCSSAISNIYCFNSLSRVCGCRVCLGRACRPALARLTMASRQRVPLIEPAPISLLGVLRGGHLSESQRFRRHASPQHPVFQHDLRGILFFRVPPPPPPFWICSFCWLGDVAGGVVGARFKRVPVRAQRATGGGAMAAVDIASALSFGQPSVPYSDPPNNRITIPADAQ